MSVKSIRYVIIKLLLQVSHNVIVWILTFTYGTRKHQFWCHASRCVSVLTNNTTTPLNKTIYLKIFLTLSPAAWLSWLGSKLLRNIWWKNNVMGYLITTFVKFKLSWTSLIYINFNIKILNFLVVVSRDNTCRLSSIKWSPDKDACQPFITTHLEVVSINNWPGIICLYTELYINISTRKLHQIEIGLTTYRHVKMQFVARIFLYLNNCLLYLQTVQYILYTSTFCKNGM